MAKRTRGLQEPTKLKNLDDAGLYQVIIKTPKGSRNKFAYVVEQRIFSLKKVLPAGMAFP
jgi:inorganic pyrophosphatase